MKVYLVQPEPQPENEVQRSAPISAVGPARPLVVVVAEASVYDLVAADAAFEVHAERYGTYDAFLEAARARQVPLERTPVIVLCSDNLTDEGSVSLSSLVSMVRDVAVVVAWNGTEHNGVVDVRGDITLNAIRQAIGTRIGVRFEAVDGGDVALASPVIIAEPAVATPVEDDLLFGAAFDAELEAELDAELARAEVSELVHTVDEPTAFAPETDFEIFAAPVAPEASAPTAAEIAAPTAPPRGPFRPARPAGRPVAAKPIVRADAAPVADDDAANAAGNGFWNRWVPAADGTIAEEAADFSDLAAALDAPDAEVGADWTPRTFRPSDMPEEITNSHAIVEPGARPFDLPPTEAELAGELFAPAPERDRLPVSQAQILAVYSPKGGVGKTSISVNLASRLALRTKLQVCIVDLDLGFGNVGTRLGLFMPTVRELLAEGRIDNESVSRNLAYDPRTGVHALLAPLRPDMRADAKFMRPENFDQILRILADRFDVIILDCPVELTDPIVSKVVMRRAHRIAMVLNNEQATLIDARRAIETMCRPNDAVRGTGLGIKPEQIGIVVNQKVDGVGRDEIGVQSLLSGEDPSHPAHTVPVIASLKDDRVTWVRNANLGRPVATDGFTEIDTNLDCALASLLPGVAELLGMPSMVTVPGVEDVWAGAAPTAQGKRFALRKRS